MRGILAKLENCRMVLAAGGDREVSQLVSVAILQLKMKLNGVADSDLKAVCDAIVPLGEPERTGDPKAQQNQTRRSPALLKLVE